MVREDNEGQSCPGDDATEVKRAMLLNALVGKADLETGGTGERNSNHVEEHSPKRQSGDRGGSQRENILVKDKWNL